MILYHDHPLLAYADFVDMPGTGSAWYAEHIEITREFVENSELVM